MSPDGRTAWVVCFDNSTIVPLSIGTHRTGPAIRVPGGPSAVAVDSPALVDGNARSPAGEEEKDESLLVRRPQRS